MIVKTNKKLIPNSTQIPNIILDFLIPRLPGAEAKCILYICRRTYGFHKEKDRISFSQFLNGIKNRKGEKLDCGSGLKSRSSVNEALKNLSKAGAIFIEKSTKGNLYEINLNMSVDKVVQKVNQYRKQTRIGTLNKPKQVRLLYPQKKGNKGNKVFIENLKKLKTIKELVFSKGRSK